MFTRKLVPLIAVAMATIACGSSAEVVPETVQTTTTALTQTTSTTPVPATTAATVAATDDGFPVTVAGAELTERPERIVSMSSTSTEMLFSIGAGDQVVAVDTLSNYPPEVPLTDLSAFDPSIEAIAAFEPDLVVIFSDPGDLAAGLAALDIPVITHGAAVDLDDAYAQITELGLATGNSVGSNELIVTMQAEIAAMVDEYEGNGTALTFYHEVDDTLYSATSSTFIGSIYEMFGLENIADPADADGFGFPQLSAEYILEADPDVIFFGCGAWCGTTAESIAERPGWDNLTAVKNGHLTEFDDDLTSRWGPRMVDFVQLVGDTLETVVPAGAG